MAVQLLALPAAVALWYKTLQRAFTIALMVAAAVWLVSRFLPTAVNRWFDAMFGWLPGIFTWIFEQVAVGAAWAVGGILEWLLTYIPPLPGIDTNFSIAFLLEDAFLGGLYLVDYILYWSIIKPALGAYLLCVICAHGTRWVMRAVALFPSMAGWK